MVVLVHSVRVNAIPTAILVFSTPPAAGRFISVAQVDSTSAKNNDMTVQRRSRISCDVPTHIYTIGTTSLKLILQQVTAEAMPTTGPRLTLRS